jgi:YspA, cpYpsA-related SLOG family
MLSVRRVLVTGSRHWDDLATIRKALTEAQGNRPSSAMLLIHGQCNPRHPQTREPIQWDTAKRLPLGEQLRLLGADWLCDVAATQMGWQIKAMPADWKRHGRERAGFIRNDDMVAGGADDCRAFIAPCPKAQCRNRKPHGSHGATHCARKAGQAGIPVCRYPEVTPAVQLTLDA